jgi:hypothetical protein
VATSLEQRFLMKELGFYTVAATLPAGAGCMGLSAQFSGYGSYSDQKYNLGYGRLFGEHFLAGISLAYVFQTTGGETRPMHQVSYGIGTVIILSDKVNLAFNSFNPFQLYFRNSDYANLPSVFRICLSWQYSSDLLLLTECEKDLDLPPQWKAGIEYRAGDIFFIRGGIRLFPLSLAFGTAMRHQRFLFEFASCYHQVLGFTPQVSLQYDFK